ncbi:hypothetical protein FOL47_009982 [Perkinsus chesapeaki]|uniref:Uncharacterized protein n=1 Tax=Perkinsus chesapeaki TaxID=330153 RepID=A0A7J6L5H1_PERCH|nr:hypothetical protein FOL47_009982 [Perkinsus chesapeaki]
MKGVPRCFVCALEEVVESHLESGDDRSSQDSSATHPECGWRGKASPCCDRCCARNTPEIFCQRLTRIAVKHFPANLSCHICHESVTSYEEGTVCLKCHSTAVCNSPDCQSKACYIPELVHEKPVGKPFICLHCLQLTFMCSCEEAKAAQKRLILDRPITLDAPFYFMLNTHSLAPQPLENFYIASLQRPRKKLIEMVRGSEDVPERVRTALRLLDVISHRSTVRRWTIREHQRLRYVLSKIQEPSHQHMKLKGMPPEDKLASACKSKACWLLEESEKWGLPVPWRTAMLYLYEYSVHEEYLMFQAGKKVHTRVCRVLHQDKVSTWTVNKLMEKIWPSLESVVFFRPSQTHRVKRSGAEHIYKKSSTMRRQMDRFSHDLVKQLVRRAARNVLDYRRWHYARTVTEEGHDVRGDRVFRCTICGPFPEYSTWAEIEDHLFYSANDAAHEERWNSFEAEMIKKGRPPDSSTIVQWNKRFTNARPGCKIPVKKDYGRYTWATPPYQATLPIVTVWDPPCDTGPRREASIKRTAQVNEKTPWLMLASAVTREKGRQDICNAWDLRKDREAENEVFLGPTVFTSSAPVGDT